ncbi:MAG: formate dehydrogenase accessory sulfurtransferase FdhD, partial [Aestuariivirga sp.]
MAKSPHPAHSRHLLPREAPRAKAQNGESLLPSKMGEGGRRPDEGSCSVSARGTLNGTTTTWSLPEEVPLAILANSQSYAVMMGTPADLEDFGAGFFLTEGLVVHASYINNVLALPSGDGVAVDVSVDESKLLRERMISRTLEGRVGCGLCGIAEMDDAIRMPNRKLKPSPMEVAAIEKAFAALPHHQPMNAINKTVHAAAWSSTIGEILLAREDVGRHNALDKLIGAMARQHINPDQGFVLMSSRCSFELVQKCATAGISGLATVSAPTALALKLSRQAGLKLASVSNSGVMVF